MKLIDIKTAIAEKIKGIGGTVTASEITEGFAKPTYFIDVLPAEIETINAFYELVTVNVEIRYIPLIATIEECIKIAEILKPAFADSIIVKDRYLDADGLSFELDASTILLSFSITFMQNTDREIPEFEKMNELNLREDV